MESAFAAVMLIVILQRFAELVLSARNVRTLKAEGGIETGQEHYKYIVLLHTAFFISMITEFLVRRSSGNLSEISYLFLVFFIFLQLIRAWVILSLGKYWNTRIIRVPGSNLVETGPYRFMRHPNYAVVSLEIICLPMIFGLIYTAVIFTVLNSVVLFFRIREEEKALKS